MEKTAPLLLLCSAAICGCSPLPLAQPAPTVSSEFVAPLQEIAKEYVPWGRVDDELRWAPFLCRQPLPGVARPSTSADDATHGQKLYSVFVKDHASYPATSAVGQVVVKESWKPQLVTDPNVKYSPSSNNTDVHADHFYPYAQKDGKLYRAAERAGLFILYKVAASTAGTDDGWVYGTLTADGQVTAAGRIDSCMSCHDLAPHDHLFGTPLAP